MQVDDKTKVMAGLSNKSSYMIDPRTNWVKRWDMCTLVLLLFTALVTPYEVAFIEVGPTLNPET